MRRGLIRRCRGGSASWLETRRYRADHGRRRRHPALRPPGPCPRRLPVTPEPRVALAPYTSLRVGGPADWFVLARSGQDLADGLRWARDHDVPVRVIGGGSNLLIAEAGVEGLVIKAAATRGEVEELHGRPV